MNASELRMGLDIGSTSVKAVVVEPEGNRLLWSDYRLHRSKQRAVAVDLLRSVANAFPRRRFRTAFAGSGAQPIADAAGALYVQELPAAFCHVAAAYPQAQMVLEVGGQDAKAFFLRKDSAGNSDLSDMRMNTRCAGGTGAFLDSVAGVLGIPPVELPTLARGGRTVHRISGRCGVFAKTDIRTLIAGGADPADIAASTYEALAKQIVGGLCAGAERSAPVLVAGGVFTFHGRLVEAIAQRLHLTPDQVLTAEDAHLVVARGAALATKTIFGDRNQPIDLDECLAAVQRIDSSATTTRRAPLGRPVDAAAAVSAGRLGNRSRAAAAAPAGGSLPGGSAAAVSAAAEPAAAGSASGGSGASAGAVVPQTKRPAGRPVVDVHIGVDGGSTSTKLVVLGDDGELLDSYYALASGDAIPVVRDGLLAIVERFRQRGQTLLVRSVGTTGYAGRLIATAIGADTSPVETLCHVEAATTFCGQAGTIVDIGGQDIKVVTLSDGIVKEIVVNEACSSGCGAFLADLATTMGIPLDRVSERALEAPSPAELGSRCTVFMNSSIITELRNGTSEDDILAGVCMSIIDNMFTKVLRGRAADSMPEPIVVQGGTFRHDAVLRAMEIHTGKTVLRPPHPELMGAIGAALLARQTTIDSTSAFIGWSELQQLEVTKRADVPCGLCKNDCDLARAFFSNGAVHTTGNKCSRGAGPTSDAGTLAGDEPSSGGGVESAPANLSRLWRTLVADGSRDRAAHHAGEGAGERLPGKATIGIPRAFELWDSEPFWRALFEDLGFAVITPNEPSERVLENGLTALSSDSVCLPAKLANGGIRSLERAGVDSIFFPMMIKTPSEMGRWDNVNMCAVVAGYPNVARLNSTQTSVRIDTPAFHWTTRSMRNKQLAGFLKDRWGVGRPQARRAIQAGDAALASFRRKLRSAGDDVLVNLESTDGFGVLLAARPYQNDQIIGGKVADEFIKLGVPVLLPESLPPVATSELLKLRVDTVNPFQVRMYSAAIYAARHPNLEVVQLVSFGCGHDPIVGDELNRVVSAVSDKAVLQIKVDEGDAEAPLSLRVRSFVETVRARRMRRATAPKPSPRSLPRPFPIRFQRKHKKDRVIFTPNISQAHCDVIAAITARSGYRSQPMPVADRRAVELGKRYVHGDVCFPAHINIGEILRVLETSPLRPSEIAIGFGKICDDCRSVQYSALARKALDDAGYSDVAIVTTGKRDEKGINPGFKLGPRFQLSLLWGLSILDAMNDILRRIRPYEAEPDTADAVYRKYSRLLTKAAAKRPAAMRRVFRGFVAACNTVPLCDGPRRDRVLVVGELLMNFKAEANLDVVRYLEDAGLEVCMPTAVDFLRRDVARVRHGFRSGFLRRPRLEAIVGEVSELGFASVLRAVNSIKSSFRFFSPRPSIHDLAAHADAVIDRSYVAGEGWIIPAEIIEHADNGVRSVVVVQPFGCMPNHVVGTGVSAAIKKRFPDIDIVHIDYDVDTSAANVENRLQMLVVNSILRRKRAGNGILSAT